MTGVILDINVSGLGNSILSFIQEKATWLLQFLPTSPFRKAMALIDNIPYMENIACYLHQSDNK